MAQGNNFKLDDFQKKAIAAVSRDHSALVSAPTGAGKTLIAEHLIEKCMKENRGVIYTAPIKALSNQKYRDFERLFPGKVGIITGDVNINPFAPLLIMTTEILRNRILESPDGLKDHSWTIFDEIHYLDNLERGTVWEESLIFLPPHMRFIGLSATMPNIRQFSDWLKTIHRHPLEVIKEDQRPVPLHFFFQCNGRIYDQLAGVKRYAYGRRSRRGTNRPLELIRHLQRNDRLPCIYFCFSRKRCEHLASDATGLDFLTPEERENILIAYDEYCLRYGLDGEERAEKLRTLVGRGIGYHHAGIHPMLKEILERLFTGKLIKIIFATETFALGINMPARTVVLDELRKNYGKFFRVLKVRDFYQMAGRSGRRGIDEEGFVYSRVSPRDISFRELKTIFTAPTEMIKSRFNVSYATILNLYAIHGENLLKLHSLSFHYFQERKRGRSQQLAQLKARLKLLKHLHYIQDNRLTDKGEFARKIHGYELPLAELFACGALEKLSTRQLGILALAAVFEPRTGERHKKYPEEVMQVKRVTSRIMRDIHRMERRVRLDPLSKKFFYELSGSMTSWMKEASFDEIMQELRIDEGEIIRYYRMSIQILREILDTSVPKTLKNRIHHAVALIDRGVIDAETQLRRTVDYNGAAGEQEETETGSSLGSRFIPAVRSLLSRIMNKKNTSSD